MFEVYVQINSLRDVDCGKNKIINLYNIYYYKFYIIDILEGIIIVVVIGRIMNVIIIFLHLQTRQTRYKTDKTTIRFKTIFTRYKNRLYRAINSRESTNNKCST